MKRCVVAVVLVLLGCAKKESVQPTPAPEAPATAPMVSNAAAEDPEPPDAQARAEAVVNADFNQNKTTTLKMSITDIVGETSDIGGTGTELAAKQESIESKLGRLAAKVTDTEITIQLPGAILFDFDSADIRSDAEKTLTDVKNVIAAYAGRPVRVEGHTDSIASDEYNQKLSEARAKSVVSWLTGHGIDGKQLSAIGFGESKPVATNDTAEGRQRNRRVEIVIARK